MKRYGNEVLKALMFITIFVVGTQPSVSNVWAQEKGDTLTKQIQGSWNLVSFTNEQDGKKTEPFGPNPKGIAIYTPDGHFSEIILRSSLPKFASNNRMKGTVEENQAIVEGAFAYFGRYTVASDKDQTVIKHVEGCTFPNWDGQDLKRIVTIIGDEMKITVPGATVGGTNYNVWKRAK